MEDQHLSVISYQFIDEQLVLDTFFEMIRSGDYSDAEKTCYQYHLLYNNTERITPDILTPLVNLLTEDFPLDENRIYQMTSELPFLTEALLLSTPDLEKMDRILVSHAKGRIAYHVDTCLCDYTLIEKLPDIRTMHKKLYPTSIFPIFMILTRLIRDATPFPELFDNSFWRESIKEDPRVGRYLDKIGVPLSILTTGPNRE